MRQLDFRLRIGCPVSVLGLSILLVTLVGCGQSDFPELGEVSGVVTWNGKPLPTAVVRFQPPSGRPSAGITDEQGKYTLLYLKDTPGAAVGRHTVSITMQPLDADQRKGRQMRLPVKYNTQTTLSADVVEGQQTIDFELVK